MKSLCPGLLLAAVLACGVVVHAQSTVGAGQNQPAAGPAGVASPVSSGFVGSTVSLERDPALSQPPRTDREADWQDRLLAQKQKVDGLQAEVLLLEKDQQRLESDCAWKQCRVMAWTEGGAGAAPSDASQDQRYQAAKERVDGKRRELAEAQRKLDGMSDEANQEAGFR